MAFTVLETLNWPGGGLNGTEKKVTGDDRFGFDESVGTAWVLDGATDLGPYRLFKKFESDAAWIAEAFNLELIFRRPELHPDIPTYFDTVFAAVHERAEKETQVDLENAARSAWPIASGMWMWHRGDETHFARLGDCLAVIRTPDGKTEIFEHAVQNDRETQTSERLNAMSPEERIEGLQKIRAIQNTQDEHFIFGLHRKAVKNLDIQTRALPADSHVLLVSDGLWRLVDVYGLMTAEELMDKALDGGIEPLAKHMREFEAGGSEGAAARIKKSDDASGVLLKI